MFISLIRVDVLMITTVCVCVCVCNRNSFQCGVMSLRRLNYDRMELERRREESQMELQGNNHPVDL